MEIEEKEAFVGAVRAVAEAGELRPGITFGPVGLFSGSGVQRCKCYEGSVGCLGPPCVMQRPGEPKSKSAGR